MGFFWIKQCFVNILIALNRQEINSCINIIRKGGVILFPTDTIWGLGCDATNQDAVEKIFKIKNRDKTKPLVILLNDENKIFDYVKEVPEVAFDLIDYSDKPLTIIYPNAKNLAKGVIAEDGSVAIRICKIEPCGSLLYNLRKPLVATSVNFSGEKASLQFNDISEDIINKVDFVFNKEFQNTITKPSQIIKLNADGSFVIIRS